MLLILLLLTGGPVLPSTSVPALVAAQTAPRSSQADRDWQRAFETAAKQEVDGKTADAIATIQAFLKRHATHADATFYQAGLYERVAGFGPLSTPAERRALESAARLYVRALELVKDPSAKFVTLWKLVDVSGADRLNRPADAERYAKRMTTEFPAKPEAHVVYARLLHERGDLAGAVAVIRAGNRAAQLPSAGLMVMTQYILEYVTATPSLAPGAIREMFEDAHAACDAVIAAPTREHNEYRIATFAKASVLESTARLLETDRQRRLALLAEADRYSAPIADHVGFTPPAPRKLTAAEAEAIELQYVDRWSTQLIDAGKFAEALKLYEDLLIGYPGSSAVLSRQGEAYTKWGEAMGEPQARAARFRQALLPLQRAIGLSPDQTSREAAFLAVLDMFRPDRLNLPSGIEEASRTMMQHYPMDPAPRATLAIAQFRAGRVAESLDTVRAARKGLPPKSAAARAAVADRLIDFLRSSDGPAVPAARPMFDAVATLITEAERLEPRSPDVMEARGRWMLLAAERFETDPVRAKSLQAESRRLLDRAYALRKPR